jgi:hypothetical protein
VVLVTVVVEEVAEVAAAHPEAAGALREEEKAVVSRGSKEVQRSSL